ncbi:uncharacterized protein [Dermacentor andersoni]|uniref:uncharacterized protein n=1 Tax=Dermacentor andersoni TaxID=34620 RepID=UPI003B3A2C97
MLWGFDPEKTRQTRCHKTAKEMSCSDMEELWKKGGSCIPSDMPERENMPEDPKRSSEDSPPVTRFRSNVSASDVVEFLRKPETIHLQMMDMGDWLRSDCECVESASQAGYDEALVVRSLACFAYMNALTLAKYNKAA